ncbi:SRPBCC family protein [Nocardia sp. GCM10030253]|uniref:SRPBCC family protein n=1 Tax=Nocardia sp. GCM10030253 TaxID=3273404 RepID=UPI003628E548
MGSVKKEIFVEASVEDVWAIIGDFGQGPIRMAPGFVTECRLDSPEVRVATFVNGTVLRERLIELDEAERRFVYSIVGDSIAPEHNNASMQVFPQDNGSRFVWIHDVLPDELAIAFGASMDQGLEVFKRTVEGAVTTNP